MPLQLTPSLSEGKIAVDGANKTCHSAGTPKMVHPVEKEAVRISFRGNIHSLDGAFYESSQLHRPRLR